MVDLDQVAVQLEVGDEEGIGTGRLGLRRQGPAGPKVTNGPEEEVGRPRWPEAWLGSLSLSYF